MSRVRQRAELTFRHNVNLCRHGWLRLTPAYSVKLVRRLIMALNGDHSERVILDPFSGTATTGVTAAESGMRAELLDINPFLVWLGNTKCRLYSAGDIGGERGILDEVVSRSCGDLSEPAWAPPIHRIERWWSPEVLEVLSSVRSALQGLANAPKAGTSAPILWIAFCRLVIEVSAAAFNHVSMSFADGPPRVAEESLTALFRQIAETFLDDAEAELPGEARVLLGDSRDVPTATDTKFTHVITSPPYPNRISYIRELRPYMYWTGFLESARQAGDLDWEAIGGTWGVATSRLKDWEGDGAARLADVREIASEIRNCGEKNSELMAQYVLKYFTDMHMHLASLRRSLRSDASLYYIVGNSSFYGIQVPTHTLLEGIMQDLGYEDLDITVVRKRNSKKELFEYCVSATWEPRTHGSRIRPFQDAGDSLSGQIALDIRMAKEQLSSDHYT